MARIEIYGNDSNVTLDDKIIGTDALDNSTKNFTVGDILALGSGGGTGIPYTAGTGIDITNNVISSTVVASVDYTDSVTFNGQDLVFTGIGNSFSGVVSLSSLPNAAVTSVVLNGTDLDFTGYGGAFNGSIDLSSLQGGTSSFGAIFNGALTSWVDGIDTTGFVKLEGGNKIDLVFDNADKQITINHQQINTATTVGAVTLNHGDSFQVIAGITADDGHIVSNIKRTYTLPQAQASSSPEALILRVSNANPIAITSAPGTDLTFAQQGSLVKTSSVHVNPSDLILASASDIEITADCTAKVSLGAYIDNGGQSGQITFQVYETSGTPTIVGEASFELSNQAVTVIPTTFFSFFDFQAGETYKFTAYSTQHAMTIVPGSFIQIEVLK